MTNLVKKRLFWMKKCLFPYKKRFQGIATVQSGSKFDGKAACKLLGTFNSQCLGKVDFRPFWPFFCESFGHIYKCLGTKFCLPDPIEGTRSIFMGGIDHEKFQENEKHNFLDMPKMWLVPKKTEKTKKKPEHNDFKKILCLKKIWKQISALVLHRLSADLRRSLLSLN